MSGHRIWAVVLRALYNFKHSIDRLSDVFIFPTINLVLWGMTSVYFQNSYNVGGNGGSYFVLAIVSAILFWTIVSRIAEDAPMVLLEDLWSRNLINAFGSPLTLGEWLVASFTVGLIKAVCGAAVAAVFALLLYKVNLLMFGFYLVPFVFLLVLSGIWLAFLLTGLIIRYGQKIQSLAWTFTFLILPFSAIYYPVSSLPHWAQIISHFLPMTYMFEATRNFLRGGVMNWNYLLASAGLNVVYVFLASLYVSHAFKVRLKNGILKLQG